MNQFKSSSELKASAREHLLGHYGTTIGAFMIVVAIMGAVTLAVSLLVDLSTIPGTIIYYAIMFLVSILTGLFSSGSAYLYLKLICGRPVLRFSALPRQSDCHTGMDHAGYLSVEPAADHYKLPDAGKYESCE